MARSTSTRVPSTVNDFAVLPLRLPTQPSFPTKATHYLYLRAHAPKIPTPSSARELFLVNVPVDATDTHLRSLFADQLGGSRTEAVAFEGSRVGKGLRGPVAPAQPSKKRKRGSDAVAANTSTSTHGDNDDDDNDDDDEDSSEIDLLPATWDRALHRSGSTAVVTFVDKASADLALKEARRAVKAGREVSWGIAGGGEKRVPALGAARYAAHQRLRFPDREELQQRVDVFMAAFAAKEDARAKALAKLRSEPDEDGFVTVTRGGRKGPAREEAVKAKEEELKQREKTRIKEDFYRFQVREKKKEHARDLVKGFEEDQRRVAEMKRRRGKIRPE